MPAADSESPEESFFNDLSQQSLDPNGNDAGTDAPEARKDDAASKQKRIACVLCRKRKLRCDGTRPTCGTCKRLSHQCTYDEVRKKSGPKRGYVKLLEARLRTCRDRNTVRDMADKVAYRTGRDSSQESGIHRTDQRTHTSGSHYRIRRKYGTAVTAHLQRLPGSFGCRSYHITRARGLYEQHNLARGRVSVGNDRPRLR